MSQDNNEADLVDCDECGTTRKIYPPCFKFLDPDGICPNCRIKYRTDSDP